MKPINSKVKSEPGLSLSQSKEQVDQQMCNGNEDR